jgi:pimeloyl-ACP methyl ester carboxylesterase
MPFLLLHGAGLGRWIWDDVLPHLEEEARAVDLPGRSNGTNPGEVTLEQCIDFVAGQTRAMKMTPVLVGHSFSGQIALAVAARFPETVASIVLIASVVPESGKPFISLMPLPQRIIMSLLLKRADHGIKIPASQVKHGYCNDLGEAKTTLVLGKMTREAPHLYLDAVDRPALPATMPRLYVKLLEDKSVSLKQQDRTIDRVHATAVETIPSGHLPMLARPEDLAETLNRWARRKTIEHVGK